MRLIEADALKKRMCGQCNIEMADQREAMCENRSVEWLASLAYHLADQLKLIGDQFDIICGEECV